MNRAEAWDRYAYVLEGAEIANKSTKKSVANNYGEIKFNPAEYKLGDWRVRVVENLSGMIAIYAEDTNELPDAQTYLEMVYQALQTTR